MPAQPLPNSVTIQLDGQNRVSIQLNLIPKGSFLMGSRGNYVDEEPVHLVEIPDDFYLGIYPVTQQQFAVWTKQAGVDHENDLLGNNTHPAENMSWFEAKQYCDWLTRRFEDQLSKLPELQAIECKVQLPTEAQWEYACSSWLDADGESDPLRRVYMDYHTGDGSAALNQAGWFADNSQDKTQRVGQKQANRHGLFDMHGNVEEWCEDEWNGNAYRYHAQGIKASNISDNGQESKDAWRVLRGGSWDDRAADCRAAFRFRFLPGNRYRDFGFRVGLFPVRS